MAEENNLAATTESVKALSVQDAPASALSEGQGTGGAPKAPVVNNTAPVKEPTAEEKAATEKATADKVVADKATADKLAADELAKTEAAKKTDELKKVDNVEYTVYNDADADAVVKILKDSNLTVEQSRMFFTKALETRNLNDIDMAGLTKALGADKAVAVKALATQYYSRKLAAQDALAKVVYDKLGGNANFATIYNYFQTKKAADPSTVQATDEWTQMLQLNARSASIAAEQMLEAYNKDPQNSSLKITMVQGDKAATTISSQGKLSRTEYLAQMKVAQKSGNQDEIAKLKAIRGASR